jgi:hypothetical protein
MKQAIPYALLGFVISGVAFAEEISNSAPAEQAANTPAPEQVCFDTATTFRTEVTAQPSLVLQLVENAVRLSPNCSCEIVKSAIEATNAEIKLVASIVEVVAVTAPEQLRISAQCAIAVAPDSVDEVHAVLAKYDPATGESGLDSEKGAKSAKSGKDGIAPEVAEEKLPNPLDFPGAGSENAVNLTPNSPGGTSGWGVGLAGNPTAVAGNGSGQPYGN